MYAKRVFLFETIQNKKQHGKLSASAHLLFRTGFRPLDSFIASRLVSQAPFLCNIVQTSRPFLTFFRITQGFLYIFLIPVFSLQVSRKFCLKYFTECAEVSLRTTNLFCLYHSLIQCQYVNNYMTIISIIPSYA